MVATETRVNTRFKHLLLVSCALLVCGQAQAQDTASPTRLDRITIEGQGESAYGPVDGIVAERSASGTKTDTPLIETPQSISVVSAEQMQEQAVQSTAEALRYVPGISSEVFGADPRVDWIRSRGFQVPEYLDGLRLPRGVYAWPNIDPYLLERIEVLKGPTSGLYGQTPPGGLVNMVSKRPTDEPLREIQFQTGDPARGQVAFDFGGALDPEGLLSYRLTGLGRLADTEIDFIEDDRLEIAPAVTWSPDAATSLTLLGHYITKDSKSLQFLPAEGTALFNPNGQIPRDTFVGEPGFDDFDYEQWGIGYLFEHQFDNGMTLRQNLRYGSVDFDLDVVRTHPAFGLRADNESLARIAARIQDETTALTVDTNLTQRFQTGAFEHEVLAGVDFIDQSTDYLFATGPVADLNIYNPTYGATVGALSVGTSEDQSLRQLGIYLQDQITFDNWHFVFSGRHDWSDSETLNRRTGIVSGTDDGQFTGRAGVLYAFDNGISPYASYSTSFEPQLGLDAAGNPFVPTEGEQFEVGIKYQPLGSNSLFSLAAYELKQDNLVVTNIATSTREQVGEVRVRGIEAEARVDLLNGWEIIGSYAYQDSEITRASDGTEGNRLPYVPEHQASAWVNYTFDTGRLAGLSLGGGVRFVGSAFGDNRNTLETDAYTLVDAGLSYDFGVNNEKLEGLNLAVNVSNLFDEEYVASCNNLNACYWGNSRTIRGTLTYRW